MTFADQAGSLHRRQRYPAVGWEFTFPNEADFHFATIFARLARGSFSIGLSAASLRQMRRKSKAFDEALSVILIIGQKISLRANVYMIILVAFEFISWES